MTPLRIMLNLSLLVSVLLLPWWISALVALVAVLMYRAYEVIFWGFVFDVLYAWPLPALANVSLVATTAAVAMFLLAEYSKRFLSFY